jgi:hypothetical protein
MLIKLGVAAFLVAHAAIHSGFLRRAPATTGGPAWPFDLECSWLLGAIEPKVRRVVALALIAATIAGFSLAAGATLSLVPGWAWLAGVATGSTASLAVLMVFFHPWLLLGVAIDIALLWAVLLARWDPSLITT